MVTDNNDLPTLEADELDSKAMGLLGGKVVRKDLTSLMRRGANVPTFVLEYLLGMYCSTEDPDLVSEGISRIRRILAENYVRPDESEAIKSRVRELGQYTIIDRVSARLDEFADLYVATFESLSIEPIVMPSEYVREYTKILQGGIWCIVRLQYMRPGEETDDALADAFEDEARARRPRGRRAGKHGPKDSPFRIASLKPIQMPSLDLDSIIEAREGFTAREWEDLLLRSSGYEPRELSERQRMHFLERMVPLIERNYNLCELGPRGTGKSHIYKEVSPYAILLSGGQTTTANLFGRMNASAKSTLAERTGVVGCWDCVTFDEVAGMRFRDTNAIQIMKDYMASGSFARGRDQISADASMVFEGNINDSIQNMLKVSHLFEPFPPEFNNDSAFFDRIHCYLPGWEVPKMRSELLTTHYGLITDCLAEYCREMRKRDFTHLLDRWFRLNGDFNTRDEIGVRKTFSGLSKLLFPGGNMTHEEAEKILRYAIEGRRRVKEQLRAMAGVEFMDVNLGYSDIGEPGSERVVYVPERSEATLIPEGPVSPGYAFGVGRTPDGEWAVYRLENKAVPGSFQFKTEGIGNSRAVHESMEASFRHFDGNAAKVATGLRRADKDYLLFMNDLQGKGPSDEVSLAEFVGLCSAACNRAVEASLVIPGVIRLSGSMDEITGLQDIFRVAKGAGAKKILLPLSCLQALQSVPAEFVGSVSPEFYPDGDAVAAARKALGL
jgi:ATP-dependent Lon protease